MATAETYDSGLWRKAWSYRGRAAELVAGLFAKRLTEIGFDYILYPYVIMQCGILYGGIVMGILSGLACLAMIRLYDWSGRDWLGVEAVKNLKSYRGRNVVVRMIAWLLHRSDPIVFMVLSIKFDPFMTTAYLRHGSFSGMTRRDWTIFCASIAVGNAYWTLVCLTGISVAAWLQRL